MSPWKQALSPVASAVALLCLFSPAAAAAETRSSGSGDHAWTVRTALKWTSLMSRAPSDPVLYPERWSSASLWRGRLEVDGRASSDWHLHLAYEHRLRTVSDGAGASGGSGILVPQLRAPYRIWQIDGKLVSSGRSLSYGHGLDRALLTAPIGSAELRIGRQALGWGRGLLFGAVDIFAPFTPLESDREWRRGVDAVRLSMPLTDLIALETVAAFGEGFDESAFVARLHGYVGNIDGELLLGRRRRDLFIGTAMSASVLDAELHGELAIFNTEEELRHGATFGRDDITLKTVVGGSYGWDTGAGTMLIGEYHFSGFGVDEIEEATPLLLDPQYRERVVLGDTQKLTRHAIALQLSRGLGGDLPSTLGWIVHPTDGSGVLTAVSSWIFSDNLTLTANLYLPYGAEPENGVLRSEYGGVPGSGLLQINFYY